MLTRHEAYNTVNFMLQYYGCLYSLFHYYITSASLYIFEKKDQSVEYYSQEVVGQ